MLYTNKALLVKTLTVLESQINKLIADMGFNPIWHTTPSLMTVHMGKYTEIGVWVGTKLNEESQDQIKRYLYAVIRDALTHVISDASIKSTLFELVMRIDDQDKDSNKVKLYAYVRYDCQ